MKTLGLDYVGRLTYYNTPFEARAGEEVLVPMPEGREALSVDFIGCIERHPQPSWFNFFGVSESFPLHDRGVHPVEWCRSTAIKNGRDVCEAITVSMPFDSNGTLRVITVRSEPT